MGTYTDFEWREMESHAFDQNDHRRSPPALPRQSFDSWMQAVLDAQAREIAVALVEMGWSEDAALEAAYLKMEDGP